MSRITKKITCFDGEGWNVEVELPAHYEVCPRCGGEGRHTDPAVDGNGLDANDFAEDPDFREDYFSGVYDVVCEECKGQKVVAAVDYDSLTDEQKKQLESHYEYQRELHSVDAMMAAERRMGA